MICNNIIFYNKRFLEKEKVTQLLQKYKISMEKTQKK